MENYFRNDAEPLDIILIGFVCCIGLLFSAIATVFQLYYGSDMMNEMRRRKPEPTDSNDL